MKAILKILLVLSIVVAWPISVRAVDDQVVDKAVVNALRFLARLQNANGSWSVDVTGESTAATSLSVMAFLAAGHVPGEGPYGLAIDRGVNYVIDHQEPNGIIVDKRGHGPMYDHGISTLMLAEVAGMTSKENAHRARKVLERAVKLILTAQKRSVNPNANQAGGVTSTTVKTAI